MLQMTEAKEQKLDQELSEEFLRKVAAWRKFEKSPLGSGENVIDLQTIKLDETAEFPNREEVQDWWIDYICRIPMDTEAGRQHVLRCDGLLAFVESLERIRVPLIEYISRTLGMKLKPYSEPYIMGASKRFAERFYDEQGFAYNERGWKRYREAEPLTIAEIKRVVGETKETLAPILLRAIDQEGLSLDFETRYRKVERPWISRIIGGPDMFWHEVNFHRMNESRYYQGVTEHARVHELFHLIQILAFRAHIQSGKLDKSWGITTIPGIEQGPMEGMAQVIPLYIPEVMDTLSPFGKLALDYSYLYDLVYNHAVLIMANDGISTDENITDFVKQYLPGETVDRIAKMVDFRRNNSRDKSYAHSYYVSHYLREKAANLDEEQKLSVVKLVGNNPVTYSELDNFINRLKATS